MLGEHENRQAGHLASGLDRGLQTFVGEGRGKADIDDRHFGLVCDQGGQQGRAVVDGCHDVEVEGMQEPGQSVPEEGMVLGDDNAHGTSMVMTVGPPGGLDMAIVPSKAARRRSIPRSPVPAAGSAPPLPLSVTTMVNRPSACRMDTDPVWARLCRIMLVSDSATAKYAADSTGVSGLPGRSMSTVIGTGRLSASARTAPPSPRSASTGGWIPRTRCRSSTSAAPLDSRASASSLWASAGFRSMTASARPITMLSE